MKIPLLILLSSFYLFASSAFISSQDLKNKISDKHLVLLDVTDSTTFSKGHIPNAVQVDVSALRYKVKKHQLMKNSFDIQNIARSLGINNDSSIVIYGHGKSKELLKASYLALALITHGAKNVSILDGGYDDWLFTIDTKSTTKTVIQRGNFTAKKNTNILVDLKYVQSHINTTPMIESRPSRYYYGKAKSKGVKRLGHIPNAMTSFWKNKFNQDESILDENELKEIFINTHKLDSKKEVIIYCTGGLEASMNWYISSQVLGFKKAKIYDASMREWGNRDDTPMEL